MKLDTELRQIKTLNFSSNIGKTSRKKYTPEVKAQVAIEALKEESTLAELAKSMKYHRPLYRIGRRIW